MITGKRFKQRFIRKLAILAAFLLLSQCVEGAAFAVPEEGAAYAMAEEETAISVAEDGEGDTITGLYQEMAPVPVAEEEQDEDPEQDVIASEPFTRGVWSNAPEAVPEVAEEALPVPQEEEAVPVPEAVEEETLPPMLSAAPMMMRAAPPALMQNTSVTLGNNGYPYGKDMTSTGFKLAIEVEGNSAGISFVWQISDDKLSWADIPNQTNSVVTISSPKDGCWYRCVVNGVTSKAIQAIKSNNNGDINGRIWTEPYNGSPWYISNGTMAYCINGTVFDVTGPYMKDGSTYMLQTSYGANGWRLYSSSENEPNPVKYNNAPPAVLDGVSFAFDPDNEYIIYISADLSDGQKSFSFGCDTKLGSRALFDVYADNAALIAQLEDDSSLKQIVMIGAASEADAVDSDPAFVITPLNHDGLRFWIGAFDGRKAFSFNEISNGEYVFGYGNKVMTKYEGSDSGMTMSWLNVPSGGTVRFAFSVGDVASTGAVRGKVNYGDETMGDLDAGATYDITYTEGGSDITVQVTADVNGSIPLAGNDKNGLPYDLIGKRITIKKQNSNDTPQQLDVAGRPNAIEATSAVLDIDDQTVSVTSDAISVNIDTNDAVKMSQEYCLYDENGNPVANHTWGKPPANGKFHFENLTPGSNYILKARVPATENAPASNPSPGIRISTLELLPVKKPHDDYKLPAEVIGLQKGLDRQIGFINLDHCIDSAIELYSVSVKDIDGALGRDGYLHDIYLTTEKKLYFIVDSNAPVGKSEVIITVHSSVYEDYHIIIPVVVNRKSTDVVLKDADDEAVQKVSASNLSDYTNAQSDAGYVEVILEVVPVEKNAVSPAILQLVDNAIQLSFPDTDKRDIGTDYLDMTVTKTVNGVSHEIDDLHRVIEIAVTYDMTDKYDPVVLREHGGYLQVFERLSYRPTGNYRDATYYVNTSEQDENGYVTIYIYTRYFSTYSILYKTKPTVVPPTVITQIVTEEVIRYVEKPVEQPAPEAVNDVFVPLARETWVEIEMPVEEPPVESSRVPRTRDDLPRMGFWLVMIFGGMLISAASLMCTALDWFESIAWDGERCR